MKPPTFKLDRCLYALLQAGELQRFTIRQLRDAYASQSGCLRISAIKLWRYIYDQVTRLKRVGWVRMDTARRRRDQLYCVESIPESLNLELVDSHASCVEPTSAEQTTELSAPAASSKPVLRLEALAKEIRLDMLTSVGEAERYKQLYSRNASTQGSNGRRLCCGKRQIVTFARSFESSGEDVETVGKRMTKLRTWQHLCIDTALRDYSSSAHFFCQATPGAGKSRMAAETAKQLLSQGLIDFVLCFGLSCQIVSGLANTFSKVLGRPFDGRMIDLPG